jgi:hypothetical protein
MKQVIFVKPFEDLKSYALCLEDKAEGAPAGSYLPLIFCVKPEQMSDEDYHELCLNLQIRIAEPLLKKLTIEDAELGE